MQSLHKTGQVSEAIDEAEQLRYVVSDAGSVWIHFLEMLLVDLADSLHALVDTLIVRVGARLGLVGGLNEQNRVRL
jgi:hypothetical protein